MKIHPIGTDVFIEDDRPALQAVFSPDFPQVWLEYADPAEELQVALGWFAVAKLQAIVDAANSGGAA